ncbi:kinase-like domain-containing protein [Pisolithus marmoratus]|nr:kinase-like domain-containing protein [Pisolithus marmoratus]
MAEIVRIDGRYTLKEKLGTGSYVYHMQDIITKQTVAIKLEPTTCKPTACQTHLEHEYQVLSELGGATGLPRPIWFGREGSYQVMVIDDLGLSLDELLKASPDGMFQLHHVAALGLQMLTWLKYIHSHHFIHHDIKLQNMLMGLMGSKDTVFHIDFGIAKQYQHPSSHIHVPMEKTGRLVGTPAFVSLNSHLGLELSWRDDLEALAYTLLFLYNGTLPWLGSLGGWSHLLPSAIHKSKDAITTGSHPKIPTELLTFLSYTHSLSFTQKLNYEYLHAILFPAMSSLTLITSKMKKLSVAHVQCASGCNDSDDSKQTSGRIGMGVTPQSYAGAVGINVIQSQLPSETKDNGYFLQDVYTNQS